MNRILIKFFSIILIGLGFYNSCEAGCDHFYVGGGISTLIPSNTLSLGRPGNNGFHITHDSRNSYGVQALVGYQRLFPCQQALGVEAGLRGMFGRSVGDRLNGVINTPRVSMPVTATFSLKPGITLGSNYLLYGLLGTAVTKISMYQAYNESSLTINAWKPGFLIGIGIQLPINNRYAVSLSYGYEKYKTVTKYFAANNFTDTLRPAAQVISLNIIDVLC